MHLELKQCNKCGAEKPRTEFYAHPRNGDGLLGKCKECAKAYAKARARNNPEKVKAYELMRAATPERMSLNSNLTAKWRKDFPDRRRAQVAVNNAVRRGKMKRQLCHVCGAEKSVAHHPDYSRPLDVVWLCQRHHKQAHALIKPEAA